MTVKDLRTSPAYTITLARPKDLAVLPAIELAAARLLVGHAPQGYHSVTLTTFRDVSWNMPFYGRLGFEVIPSEALSPALRSIVQDETRRGLDPTRRVAMRRPCAVY